MNISNETLQKNRISTSQIYSATYFLSLCSVEFES